MFVQKGLIYEAEEPYDSDLPEYDCYMPNYTGNYGIVDCWICDSKGNTHPGYNVSPVPINTGNLGQVVGRDVALLLEDIQDPYL